MPVIERIAISSLCLLAICLCSAQIQQKQNSQEHQEIADKAKNDTIPATSTPAPPAENISTKDALARQPKTNEKQTNSSKENANLEKWWNWIYARQSWFWPPTWSNWVLAVAAIIGICVTVKTLKAIQRQAKIMISQARVMQRQARTMEEQTKASKTAADAARDNARAVLNSERAWMDIDLGPPEKDPDISDNYGRYSIRIINRGRTVARIERIEFGINAVNGPFDLSEFSSTSVNFNILLGNSDKHTVVTTINIPYQFPDWDSIRDEKARGFIRIGVTYRDVLESTIPHESAAIYVWDTREEEPDRVAIFSTYT